MANEVVILKKINKLDLLKIPPNLYKTDSMDKDGEMDGIYKGNTFIGSKRNVTPQWDSLKDRWAFDGTVEDLQRIQDRLRFRDENNVLIVITEDTFRNMEDPFWASKPLWNTKIMDEGSTSLNPKNPIEELLIRVHKGASYVKDSTENQSPYLLSESNLEIINPQAQAEGNIRGTKKLLHASKLLDSSNSDKKYAIAYIMQIPGFDTSQTDDDTLLNLLFINAVENTGKIYKYGTDITYQEKFIELAELKNEQLNIALSVSKAKLRGGIVNKPGGFTFNGDKIDGGSIKNEKALMDYYLNVKNVDARLELDNYLEATKDIR